MAALRELLLRLLYRAKIKNRNRMPDSHRPEEMELPQGATRLRYKKGGLRAALFEVALHKKTIVLRADPLGRVCPLFSLTRSSLFGLALNSRAERGSMLGCGTKEGPNEPTNLSVVAIVLCVVALYDSNFV
jgi:hypothetical protein